MTPQSPPQLWRGRSAGGWAALLAGLVVGAPLTLVVGVVLLALGAVAAVVGTAGWLVGMAAAWVWYVVQRARRVPYPFPSPPPTRRRARRIALSGLYLSLVPRTVGGAARLAGWLLAPLALGAGVAGLVFPRWRARPYLAVFTLPGLLRKVVGLGRRRGLLRDGHDARLLGYDEFLAQAFPLLHDFFTWWADPDSRAPYRPPATMADSTAARLGLRLGPAPDPLGAPGLAAGAMRRRAVRSLREVFLSQREIDDLCDPDLDDRADVAVIRVISRVEESGRRRWIVQLPSTKSWHPRAGAAPNDLTADLVIGTERQATITRAAIATMRAAGIRTGEPVLLTGFSLGGMVAAQIAVSAAADGFAVTHLVVGGSPLGRFRLPSGVHALSLEHVLDIVPRIDGRDNAVSSAAGGLLTVKARPPLTVGFRLGALHQSTAYADTAAVVEARPPDERVAAFLRELAPFLGPGQLVDDRAALRAGDLPPRAAVPLYLRSTVEEGITRLSLRQTVRRIPGVIAVDVYQSRSGFATTVIWNADILATALAPWPSRRGRAAVYRGLLSLLGRRGAVGVHLRVQAKRTPGITWEATLQRAADGRWRETIDITIDDRADPAEVARLFPGGTAPIELLHPPRAFGPVVGVASPR
ncbi:hypothetical protein IT072_02905 [Leifsonia sp. ZF2019]|uniref:hypothetical protein n=1 Tax=Leifsonia sp. ZF2019 TaxID=2781978 RepID=UPI001CBB203A|nr:hypothetical protein [Leifsonia sp. ZF2019]UAJ80042.1 hypothetical protein IT072_02905 [Leifsonia sp. ZF2019]